MSRQSQGCSVLGQVFRVFGCHSTQSDVAHHIHIWLGPLKVPAGLIATLAGCQHTRLSSGSLSVRAGTLASFSTRWSQG